MIKYVSTYTKVYLKKKDEWRTYLMMPMWCFCVLFSLIFFIKPYGLSTHLNVDAIQMGTHNISLYKEVHYNLFITQFIITQFIITHGGGWEWQWCRVSYVTGASNWNWLTVGQGLLSL